MLYLSNYSQRWARSARPPLEGTINWTGIKQELGFSGILGLFSSTDSRALASLS